MRISGGQIENDGQGNAVECVARVHVSFEEDPGVVVTIDESRQDYREQELGKINAGDSRYFGFKYTFPYPGTYDFRSYVNCSNAEAVDPKDVNNVHLSE